ncbi:MAG: tRNA (N6-threonylcarbamoyladenosine(37)-N6)-methyltransferase TrmO [Deltaproteobacteria bacterium]|nr:tRNA (N6-threonylcarbamoyladenosine(37)-N6)-methyltransferase TrmO [Deltaproteobacteria bacterium]
MQNLILKPVGRVIREGGRTTIEILPAYVQGLEGLADFSHIWVIYWFHKNDTPEQRAHLRVHPRGDPANPLTGVFATRSPVRPNLLGLSVCRLSSVQGNLLEVEDLDAFHDTPVVDLKPYLPEQDALSGIRTPPWVRHRSWSGEEGQGKGQY